MPILFCLIGLLLLSSFPICGFGKNAQSQSVFIRIIIHFAVVDNATARPYALRAYGLSLIKHFISVIIEGLAQQFIHSPMKRIDVPLFGNLIGNIH